VNIELLDEEREERGKPEDENMMILEIDS